MALPQHAYRDPAKIAEADELHRLGCGGCVHGTKILGRYLCPNNLKYPACKKDPRKGYKLSPEAGGEQ